MTGPRRVPPSTITPSRLVGAAVLVVLVLALLVWIGTQTTNLGDPGVAGPTATGTAVSPRPSASTSTDPGSRLPVVALADLPVQAAQTVRLIDAGGPYPYAQDGSVFGNVERRLPRQARGYYTEYTVRTPGSRDRGARRIIAGQGGELYWTADHYASFSRIRR